MIAVLLTSCSVEKEVVGQKKIKIVTTLFPLTEFAKAVVKDKADVTLLIPPGVEAHDYDPKPSDIKLINEADIFIYTSDDMEPWVADILKGIDNKGLVVIKASDGINLIQSKDDTREKANDSDGTNNTGDLHGTYDPHFWLDFTNDEIVVDKIANVISGRNQEYMQFYLANAISYKEQLDALDKRYSDGLKDCKTREFIFAGHAAFAYLDKRYNLDTVSLYGISPDTEPTPMKMKEIIDIANKMQTNYIFFETFVDSKVAQTLAFEIKKETLVLNPGDNVGKDEVDAGETFISLMDNNLANLEKGLGCSS